MGVRKVQTQRAKVTFKVIQTHWQLCHSTDGIHKISYYSSTATMSLSRTITDIL